MKTIIFTSSLIAIGSTLLLFGLSACSSSSTTTRSATVVQERYVPADPGAVEFVYEPPIVNVIDIPPGLDPEGIYYRPAHQTVVEIKQGRWQYYQQGQ
jgi:uncharacterized lipoprotein YmbA